LKTHWLLTFPLLLDEYNDIINIIESELEIRTPAEQEQNSYNLVIQARVSTVADVEAGEVVETFVQSMEIEVTADALAFDRQLYTSRRDFLYGSGYKQEGNFAYTIRLTENSLYEGGVTTVGPGIYRPPYLTALPPGDTIYPRITDIVNASFSYQFLSDRPVSNLTEEIKVTAILESEQLWKKEYVLIPQTPATGTTTLFFSLDVSFFAELVDVLRNEIGVGLPTNTLTLEATVHTTADTDYGPIDEVYIHTLEG